MFKVCKGCSSPAKCKKAGRCIKKATKEKVKSKDSY